MHAFLNERDDECVRFGNEVLYYVNDLDHLTYGELDHLTCGELNHLTYGDLDHLTYGELDHLTYGELVAIMHQINAIQYDIIVFNTYRHKYSSRYLKFRLLQFANDVKEYEKTYEIEKLKWLIEFAMFCRNHRKNCIDSWEHANLRCIFRKMCHTCENSSFTTSCEDLNFADECKFISDDKNDSSYMLCLLCLRH